MTDAKKPEPKTNGGQDAGIERSAGKEAAPEVEEVQKAMDDEQARGYRGADTDPTPNANYTVAGVVAGKPTPETDNDQAEKARRASGPVRG